MLSADLIAYAPELQTSQKLINHSSSRGHLRHSHPSVASDAYATDQIQDVAMPSIEDTFDHHQPPLASHHVSEFKTPADWVRREKPTMPDTSVVSMCSPIRRNLPERHQAKRRRLSPEHVAKSPPRLTFPPGSAPRSNTVIAANAANFNPEDSDISMRHDDMRRPTDRGARPRILTVDENHSSPRFDGPGLSQLHSAGDVYPGRISAGDSSLFHSSISSQRPLPQRRIVREGERSGEIGQGRPYLPKENVGREPRRSTDYRNRPSFGPEFVPVRGPTYDVMDLDEMTRRTPAHEMTSRPVWAFDRRQSSDVWRGQDLSKVVDGDESMASSNPIERTNNIVKYDHLLQPSPSKGTIFTLSESEPRSHQVNLRRPFYADERRYNTVTL